MVHLCEVDVAVICILFFTCYVLFIVVHYAYYREVAQNQCEYERRRQQRCKTQPRTLHVTSQNNGFE